MSCLRLFWNGIDGKMRGSSSNASHSSSVLAWGLERSQHCHFCSDSSFLPWNGLEMMNHFDILASSELGFSCTASHLGLWWCMSILIPVFLSLSLSTILISCHTVYLGRTILVLSPWGLICLWLCELDWNVPVACSGFLVVVSIFSVCWWVCEVGAWQLLVQAIHTKSLLEIASLSLVVYHIAVTVHRLWAFGDPSVFL